MRFARPRTLGLALVAAAALLTTACVVTPLATDYPGIPGRPGAGAAAQGTNPILHAFTASPMATANKDDKITFTVVANSPANLPLQYNWSATKGTLSSNTGQVVY